MKLIAFIALLIVGVFGPVARAGEAALAEVNAARAKRGLPAFLPDPALTIAADRAAAFRAERGIAGHVDDFRFVPAGHKASAAGCGAWGPRDGWGTCCTYDQYRYAGAAWCLSRDGKTRYMHLFVR